MRPERFLLRLAIVSAFLLVGSFFDARSQVLDSLDLRPSTANSNENREFVPPGPPGSKDLQTVSVNCDDPKRDNSIGRALEALDPAVTTVLYVSGTCRENVMIRGFRNLWLVGDPTATLVDRSGGTYFTLYFGGVGSGHLAVTDFVVQGGSVGIFCADTSVCRIIDTTVRDTTLNGIAFISAKGVVSNVTIENGRDGGLSLGSQSQVVLRGGTIRDHGRWSILLRGSSELEVSQTPTARATLLRSVEGVRVEFGSTLWLSGTSSDGPAGISARDNSTVWLMGNNEIVASAPGWAPVSLQGGSVVSFVNANALAHTGGGAGVVVGDLSFAEFGSWPLTISVTGGLKVDCRGRYAATHGVAQVASPTETNCVE